MSPRRGTSGRRCASRPAWLLAQGDDVAPIPGTKRRTRLEENLGASDVELSRADLDGIDAVFPPDAAAGERYADMSHIDR